MRNADMGRAARRAENIYCQTCGKTTTHGLDGDGIPHCPQCQKGKVPGPSLASRMFQGRKRLVGG